jgi:hypothetical protein
MSLHTFTLLHVAISILQLAVGAVVVAELVAGRRSALTALNLVVAALTSLTGFLFPFHGVTPAIMLGVISTLLLVLAAAALYGQHLRGGWRTAYAISAVVLLYLDAFVAVVQSFEKIGPLHMQAPTGKEAPFAVAQGVLLLAFIAIGYLASSRFRRARIVAVA